MEGRQRGIPKTQHPLLPMGCARVQFPFLSSRWCSEQSHSWTSLTALDFTAAGQPCQVVISSSTGKENLGPFFLLGTLEVSPSIYLTPISLSAASKGRVVEEPCSQVCAASLFSPFQRQLGRRVQGCREGRTRKEGEIILQVGKEGKCQGPNTKFITF